MRQEKFNCRFVAGIHEVPATISKLIYGYPSQRLDISYCHVYQSKWINGVVVCIIILYQTIAF